jgi:hypothetical protein
MGTESVANGGAMSRPVAALAALVILAGTAPALPASHYNMGPVHRFAPEPPSHPLSVSLSNGIAFTPGVRLPDLPAGLMLSEAGARYFIIQFQGPVEQSWMGELAQLGVEPFGYLPDYAVIARLTPSRRALVASLPMVVWTGVFQPAYKLQQGLLDGSGRKRVVILVTPGEHPEALVGLIGFRGHNTKPCLTAAVAGVLSSHGQDCPGGGCGRTAPRDAARQPASAGVLSRVRLPALSAADGGVVPAERVEVRAYCLMPNHVHLGDRGRWQRRPAAAAAQSEGPTARGREVHPRGRAEAAPGVGAAEARTEAEEELSIVELVQ